MRFALLFAALSAQAFALGPISLGLRAGLPLNDLVDIASNNPNQFFSTTQRYTFGPTLALNLPAGLSAEVDFLWKRFSLGRPIPLNERDFNSFEIPVMGKWRSGGGLVRPIVGAGVSFRRWGDFGSFLGGDLDRNNTGFVLGGGIEIRAIFLKITPEIRYTRWGSQSFTPTVQANRNQVDFLVGLTF